MCLSTCIHVEKLQCSAKSNPAFRYELSQQSPPSLDLGPSPSPSLLCRLAAQTRTKGTEGKGRSPMKRTRRKQPASRPALPPLLRPRKLAAFLFLGKEQGVNRKEKERIEGIRWGETPCRCVTGWVANREATKDSLPFADSSHCSEPQRKRSAGRGVRRLLSFT